MARLAGDITNGVRWWAVAARAARFLKRPTVLVAACVAAACGDQGPVAGPGVLTATLTSPNGAEGAAVVELLGDGLGEVTALGETEAHAHAAPDRTRVVLIHRAGGTLAFRVAVQDTTHPPAYVIREVAGPDDRLRASTAEYLLELRP